MNQRLPMFTATVDVDDQVTLIFEDGRRLKQRVPGSYDLAMRRPQMISIGWRRDAGGSPEIVACEVPS